MPRLSRRALALLVTGGALAVATPALGVTATCTGSPATCVAGVPVSVVGLGGTRQFTVEDVHGDDLAALDLGTGGAQPFRLHVNDAGFTATGQSFSVAATMTHLYLRQGAGHDYAVKVPSSDVAIGFGGTPLGGKGISLDDLPTLSVSGTLSSCLDLSSTLQAALGLNLLGIPLDLSNINLTTLCSLLGVVGGPVAATVDGALQTVTPTLSDLLDLPVPLSGATGGAFANPSFAAGTVGAADPAANATPATSVPLMSGGAMNLTAGLISSLSSALTAQLAGLPLVNATDTGTRTTVAALVDALSTAPDAISSTLGAVLSALPLADQLTVLTSLTSSLVAPVGGDIAALNGDYYAFPILRATPNAPVAGTYDGTLTVTFVQS
jgi:hypothetical protein